MKKYVIYIYNIKYDTHIFTRFYCRKMNPFSIDCACLNTEYIYFEKVVAIYTLFLPQPLENEQKLSSQKCSDDDSSHFGKTK